MENENTTANSQANNEITSSLNPQQSIKTSQLTKIPKQKSYLPILLTALVLILSGTTVFFAYQNYQLKKTKPNQTQSIPTTSINSSTPIPSPNPTADWETYSNEIYNYSFKYPPFASVKESNFMGTIQSTTITLNEEKFIDIYIQLTENWNGTDNANLKEKNYSVNGISALKESNSDSHNPPQQIIYFESNNIVYRIQLNYTGEQEYADLFDQILSTFKLENENNYINSQLGFSLKIPNSWSGFYEAETSENKVIFNYQSENLTYPLFIIQKITQLEWETLVDEAKEQQLPPPFYGQEPIYVEELIGEDDKNLFFFTPSIDNPFTGTEGDRYENLFNDIKQIESSFRIHNN